MGALAAAVLALVWAGDLGVPVTTGVDLQGAVTFESRAGESPVTYNLPPVAFVAEILTPMVALELREPRLNLDFAYAPRIYWEDPKPQGTSGGILVLHNATLALLAHPSRRVSMSLSAHGSYGQPDYIALTQSLGVVQGVIPPIETIASASLAGDLRAELTRRWQLFLDAQFFYWQLLNAPSQVMESSSAGQFILTTEQTTFTLQPGASFALTPRDNLSVGAVTGYSDYSTGVQIISVTPTIGWATQISRHQSLKLTLGVSFVHNTAANLADQMTVTDPTTGQTVTTGLAGSHVSPVGSLLTNGRLWRRDNAVLTGTIGAGVDYYFDPVLGVATPRASTAGRLTLTLPPDWTVELVGDFATALLATPPVGDPDETAFSLTLPVRRRLSDNLLGEAGVRWADRGPILEAPGFHFHQRQIWFYVSLTGTTKASERLRPPAP